MHRIFRVKAYEKEHGPHFNEEYARKAVMKMENEDGTRGPHWSLEETTTFPPFWGAGFPFFFGRRRRRLNTISGIPVLTMKQMLPQNMQNVMKEVDQ